MPLRTFILFNPCSKAATSSCTRTYVSPLYRTPSYDSFPVRRSLSFDSPVMAAAYFFSYTVRIYLNSYITTKYLCVFFRIAKFFSLVCAQWWPGRKQTVSYSHQKPLGLACRMHKNRMICRGDKHTLCKKNTRQMLFSNAFYFCSYVGVKIQCLQKAVPAFPLSPGTMKGGGKV